MDHPDHGPAILHERERDTEERQAVGVVDGAVDRVADPHAGGDRRIAARFLAEERVGGKRPGQAVPDERLGGVVDLGHDVAGTLVRHRATVLVAAGHEEAGRLDELDSGRELRAPCATGWRALRRRDDRGHREQSTANERACVPRSATRCSNASVPPAGIDGVRTNVSTGGLPR